MSFEFQERADGYRVVRAGPGDEMLCSINTKRQILSGTIEWEQALIEHVLALPADKREQVHADAKASGATLYVPLPRAEYRFHGTGGPIKIGDLEEILAALK